MRRLTIAAALAVLTPLTLSGLQDPAEMSGPGPEHERFEQLAGSWNVRMATGDGGEGAQWAEGTAENVVVVDGLFLRTAVSVPNGVVPRAEYTLAFDRRHGRYDVVLMDNSGTYFVTARGMPSDDGDTLTLYGDDDDPFMASLGFEKAFVIEYRFLSSDEFTLQTRFVDTRTEARTEQPFVTLHFTR